MLVVVVVVVFVVVKCEVLVVWIRVFSWYSYMQVDLWVFEVVQVVMNDWIIEIRMFLMLWFDVRVSIENFFSSFGGYVWKCLILIFLMILLNDMCRMCFCFLIVSGLLFLVMVRCVGDDCIVVCIFFLIVCFILVIILFLIDCVIGVFFCGCIVLLFLGWSVLFGFVCSGGLYFVLLCVRCLCVVFSVVWCIGVLLQLWCLFW